MSHVESLVSKLLDDFDGLANSIQDEVLNRVESNQGQVIKQKDTREGAPWERLFAEQKEHRQALC